MFDPETAGCPNGVVLAVGVEPNVGAFDCPKVFPEPNALLPLEALNENVVDAVVASCLLELAVNVNGELPCCICGLVEPPNWNVEGCCCAGSDFGVPNMAPEVFVALVTAGCPNPVVTCLVV